MQVLIGGWGGDPHSSGRLDTEGIPNWSARPVFSKWWVAKLKSLEWRRIMY